MKHDIFCAHVSVLHISWDDATVMDGIIKQLVIQARTGQSARQAVLIFQIESKRRQRRTFTRRVAAPTFAMRPARSRCLAQQPEVVPLVQVPCSSHGRR